MGKGERGKVEESRREYQGPAYESSARLAGRAGDIYYGAPAPRQAQPVIDMKATPEGYVATSSEKYTPEGAMTVGTGQPVNWDRVYEVYRWWVSKTNGDPERLREHPYKMGDAEWKLLDQIVDEHGTDFKPAFDYRAMQQKGDTTPEQLARFAPSNTGLGDWSGAPMTEAMLGIGPAGQQMTGPGGVVGGTLADYGNIAGRFGEFADTGGYSPEDLANIRARAVSPIRSIYSSARRDVDRQRALQGGYSPGRQATLAKLAREQSYATSDAATNVEAAIAQMVNQGRRYGVSGLSSLYGTTPGLASMFGSQALQAQQLQNQMGLGMTNAQMQAAGLPGPWETTTGRIGQIGGAVYPWIDVIRGRGGGSEEGNEGGGGFWSNLGRGAAAAGPLVGAFLSDKNAKEDIDDAPPILGKLRKLPIHTWKYKGDDTTHIGPMAQDFAELFGGDDKTIHPVDVAGVALGAIKEIAEGYR